MLLLWPVLLSGKVVLITGASRGIGAACAEAFGKRGALLSLTARSAVHGPDALVTQGDITDPEFRRRVVDRTVERYGRIDLLLNNAGMGSYRSVAAADQAETRRLFELNFFAPLAMTQLTIPFMPAGSTIVNVSSVAGKVTLPWMTLYSASKYALGSLTDGLRMELRGRGIHAMTVCPGYVLTDFHDHAMGTPPAAVARAKRYAIPAEQCAEAIARGVERQARTVVTPWWGWLLVGLERVAPSVVDSRLSRMSL